LREVAAGHGLTPFEVNLAWLLNRHFHTLALVSLPCLLTVGAQLESASQLLLPDFELSALRPF
jgi:aryl-alcohol dehydrogenase-like predicted oxidoreductase